MEKIKKLIKSKYLWLVLCQLLIFYVAVKNTFPNGYIFSGGDITQYYNLSHITKGLHYTWSNLSGEGFFLQYFSYSLYYSVVFFLKSLFHLSNSGQSFFYFFLFLSGSFWSFYLSSSNYLEKIPKNTFYSICFALIYTFNFYTINSFYFIWGYSPFLTLYVLVPAIFGLSYKYFSEKKVNLNVLLLLVIPFFLTNIANGNMAFFIALNVFLALFIILIYLLSEQRQTLKLYLKKIVLFYLLYFLCVCWSVLPQLVELLKMASNFSSGASAIFDVKAWILWQAISFPDVLFLVPHLIDFVSTKIFLGSVLFFVFILTIVTGHVSKKPKLEKISLIYLVLLVIGIFLENKGVGILGSGITVAIFSNPILGALRSNDKVFTILPFLIIILVFLQLKSVKHRNLIVGTILALSVAFTFPFFTGGLQTKYSSAFTNGVTYQNSQGSFIHAVPNEYFDAAAILNQRLSDSKILRAPFNVLNSPGWVNFTKWGVTGVDPTTQLFNSPAVEMNGYGAFGNWSYGQVWAKQSTSDSTWLLPMTGYLNTRYLVYHKDIAQKYITETSGKIADYKKAGSLSQIYSGDYFDLYRISDQYYLPHVYVPTQSIVTNSRVAEMSTLLGSAELSDRSALFLSTQNQGKSIANIPSAIKMPPTLEYKKINPTKYRVVVHGATSAFPLVLSEAFHSGWQVYQSDHASALEQNLEGQLSAFSTFAGNGDDQASLDDLKNYIKAGKISSLGDGKNKDLKGDVWTDGKETVENIGKYTIDFISKSTKGTIQNNNLSDGKITDNWLAKPVISEANHFVANGYSNGWLVNASQICEGNLKCQKNSDGSYDFDLLVDFGPQHLYYLSLWISSIILTVSLIALLILYFRKRTRK